MVEFDYYVRVVQTLVQKDRLTDVEGRAEIRALSHSLFALFQKAMRWERLLLREDLQPLCRADFKPDADDLAQQRVKAAAAAFGKLPRNVLLGSELPRHTKRRVPLPAARQTPVTPTSRPLTGAAEAADAVDGEGADNSDVSLPDPHANLIKDVSRETVDVTLVTPL